MLFVVRVHFSLIVPSHGSIIPWLQNPRYIIASILSSVIGKGKSSLGQAACRSLKSTHTRTCLFFLRTGTMLEIHLGYLTSLMKPAAMNFVASASIWATSSGRILLWACFTGLHSSFLASQPVHCYFRVQSSLGSSTRVPMFPQKFFLSTWEFLPQRVWRSQR